jgi:hypothetical protein
VDKNNKDFNKDDKDIRREIEELEKLIEKVKKQNEEDKKKQKDLMKTQKRAFMRIDLSANYSSNKFLNYLASFLINFIVIFAVIKLFSFAEVSNDYYLLLIAFVFTFYEELYKTYLIKKHIQLILYSSGLIFYLMNLIFFYFMDLVVLGDNFSFVQYLYPLLFVLVLQAVRLVLKNIFLRISRAISLSRIGK